MSWYVKNIDPTAMTYIFNHEIMQDCPLHNKVPIHREKANALE